MPQNTNDILNSGAAAKGGNTLNTVDIPEIYSNTFATQNGLLAVSSALGAQINLVKPIDRERRLAIYDTDINPSTKTDFSKHAVGTANTAERTVAVGSISAQIAWSKKQTEDFRARLAQGDLEAVVNRQTVDSFEKSWNEGFSGLDNGFVRETPVVTHVADTIAAKVVDDSIPQIAIEDMTGVNTFAKAVALAKRSIAQASNGSNRADGLIVPDDFELIDELNKAEVAADQFTSNAHGLVSATDFTLAQIVAANDVVTDTGKRVIAVVAHFANNFEALIEGSLDVSVGNGILTNTDGAVVWSTSEMGGKIVTYEQYGTEWFKYASQICVITRGTGAAPAGYDNIEA